MVVFETEIQVRISNFVNNIFKGNIYEIKYKARF